MYRWPLQQAARTITRGGIIAYPTEAVYGLGCDPCNAQAVERLLNIKHRGPEKGLILIAADLKQLLPFIHIADDTILKRIMTSWPGPVTWLLPRRLQAPDWLSGQHDSIAVRITAHPLAAALCNTCHSALISTSANISGHAAARNALQLRLRFGSALDYILHGECSGHDQPTEIRDAVTGRVIRTSG